MKNYIASLDFEKVDLTHNSDTVIEVALTLIDIKLKQEVLYYHKFVYDKYKPVTISPEIEELTGINISFLKKFGLSHNTVIWEIKNILAPSFSDYQVTHLVAHNGRNFDFPILYDFIDKYLDKNFGSIDYVDIKNIPVIDTMTDLPYPKHVKSRSLKYACFDMGIVHNVGHRAIHDVLAMNQLLFKFDFEEVKKLAIEPKYMMKAEIGSPWDSDFKEKKQLAIGYGFRWNPELKIWSKLIRESEAKSHEFPFEVCIFKQ
jgi:DNA polymerase III alpha subunit (gram-positive type)